MSATSFPRFKVLDAGTGAGAGLVDLEDKDCLMNVCPRCPGARDTSSGSITGKVTSAGLIEFTLAPGLDEITGFACASTPERTAQIPEEEIQWRRALGTGAAARASTDKPRSSGESYSDSSESRANELTQGTGIGGSGVRITL